MQSAPIESLCVKVSSGGTPSRKRPEFYASGNSGHLWVKSKELLDGPIDDTEEKISDEGLKGSSAKYFPANTVLMAMYGANVGQLGWLKRPATVNQAVCGMVVNEEIADPRYVFYALLYTRTSLTAKAQGAAQQNLNQGLIKEFEIPTPCLEAQEKIAAILSAYDDLIENNTRRIKILEEMAQAIYREWFVKFRFPGHEKVKMIDSPLGPIPEGWEVTKLGKVASVNELSIKKNNEPAKIEYIDIKSVGTGFIEKTTSYSFQKAPGRARRIVRDGDTIWSTVRPNRKSYSLILDPAENLVASTGFAVLTPKEVPFTFLYHVVTTDEFVEYLVNHATGAAYPAVNAKDFSNADIVKPSDEVLALFNNAVESMYRYKHLLDKKNRNLRRIRDILLPRLVSGDLPVDMADSHIVAVG